MTTATALTGTAHTFLPLASLQAALSSQPAASLARVLATLLLAVLCLVVWQIPEDPSANGRIALIVTLVCVFGWTFSRIPDSIIAIAGAVTLVAAGVLPQERFYAALGHEMVWLLVAAFLMAAVLRNSGGCSSAWPTSLSSFSRACKACFTR
jgi:hypothetical protein